MRTGNSLKLESSCSGSIVSSLQMAQRTWAQAPLARSPRSNGRIGGMGSRPAVAALMFTSNPSNSKSW